MVDVVIVAAIAIAGADRRSVWLLVPLGLALAPDGDILATNAGNGNVVEITPAGRQLLTRPIDTKTGAGSLFGLAIASNAHGIYFTDDGDNTLRLLH